MLTSLLPDVVTLPPWSGGLAVLLVKATIILVAAIAITRQMHRASAGARHLVWLVTLGTLLFVPALTAWAPLAIRILPARAARTDRAASQVRPTPRRPDPTVTLAIHPATAMAASTTPTGAAAFTPSSTPPAHRLRAAIDAVSPAWTMWLGLLMWGAIALVIACALAWSALAVRRIVRRASPLDDPVWRTPLLEVSDRLGLGSPPRLLVSHDIKMPFACGVITPTIVLPAECDAWSLDRRQSVLLHELAHVRRGDLPGHLLGRLVCAVYWFHPLVWMAAKRLRSESERACDDLALACGTRATDYAEHLLDIVSAVRTTATPTMALAMARRKEFEGRLLAILDPDLRHSTPSRRQSAALITVLVLSASLVAAAAPMPRLTAARSGPVTIDLPATTAHQPPATDRPVQETRTHDLAAVATPRSVSPARREAALGPAPRPATIVPPAAERAGLQAEASVNATNRALQAEGFVRRASSAGRQEAPDDRATLLAKVLRTDSSAHLRRIAAWGLRDFASSSVATDALVNAVAHDADTHVREMAAWSLSNYGPEAAVSAALAAAVRHDASEDVRATAAWSLGDQGSSASADALIAALSDSSSRVRERAAWALGNVGPKEAPASLIAMLHDHDEECRQTAAWALYQIRDPAALPALESALRVATDEDSQLTYLRAIAAMGDRSVDVIRNLLDSSNPRIKSMAIRALAGGEATGPWPRPRPEPRPFP
jgi:beta-lactamase regulating signal transducer with metallopeptidase domain/HEAT repeat protein